ncbi:MAG TPA: signal peptidase I [Gammaproteobacteria bacterium]|nr:signal peptidase I [Gammaproteobacteria bacterium]
MDFDLEALLSALTLLSGGIWLADALYFARRRRAREETVPAQEPASGELQPRLATWREPIVVEYSKSFFPVLLIVLLLRSFVAEPFHIPSSSMVPTLLIGDFILVNKFDYGLRLPVLHTKVLDIGEPQRGDVVVFHFPEQSALAYCRGLPSCVQEAQKSAGTDFIKRVVGMPGDHVVYRDETLYINGVAMPVVSQGVYDGPDSAGAMLNREQLGDVSHGILAFPGYGGKQGEWIVPQGQYFVMGDNRDNSWDSRFWGFVPERNLVGKAFFIWMNWDAFGDSRLWKRVGNSIH